MSYNWSMTILKVALLVWLACCKQCTSTCIQEVIPPEFLQNNGSLYAQCKMRPSTALPEGLPKVYGQALFKHDPALGKLQILLRFTGFPKDEAPHPRAVHIHQYGDLSRGCDSTGGHYNPLGVNHPNHPGDFGNFEAENGRIYENIKSEATLFGHLSVIGRAVVIHETMDDLGQGGDAASLLNGNAGKRLACCVIGVAPPNIWHV